MSVKKSVSILSLYLYFILSFLSMLSLTSCGGNVSDDDEEDPTYKDEIEDHEDNEDEENEEEDDDEADSFKYIAKSSIVCGSSNCPKNLVGITIWTGLKYERESYLTKVYKTATQCTGFMVSPKLVATNDHCVESLSSSQCADEIVVNHIDGSQSRCAKIIRNDALKFSSANKFNQDLALIELEKAVDIESVRLTREGFRDNESVTIAKVNPSFSIESPSMAKITKCRVLENSLFSYVYNSENKLYPPLYDCDDPIVSGNSGSMILKNNGSIGGILFAVTQENDQSSFVNHAFGLNFMCLNVDDITLLKWDTSKMCSVDAASSFKNGAQLKNKTLESKLRKAALEAMLAIEKKHPKVKYKMESATDGIRFSPECLFKKSLVEERLPIYLVKLHIGTDKDYKATVSFKTEESFKLLYSLPVCPD